MALIPRLNTTRVIDQGDLNPVGMIVASMLTEAQFQALNGTKWVLAAGQSIAGSSYATITGSSTAPDLRGRVVAGKDDMGGTAASRLTSAGSGVDGLTLGATGGAQTHTLSSTQMPSHTHTQDAHFHAIYGGGGGSVVSYGTATNSPAGISGAGSGYISSYGGTQLIQSSTGTNQNTGGGLAHNNTQPTLVVNYFIKIN